MPPQPLSKVRRDAKFHFERDTLEKYPELAAIILRVINIGSLTDAHWSSILVSLLKADPKPGMAMYEALTSNEAKRAALLAAARARMNEDDYALFGAVLDSTAPTRRIRNRFAHYLWGYSPQISNALLLADPANFTRFETELAEVNREMNRTRSLLPPPKFDTSQIEVWRKRSLEEAARDASACLDAVKELWTGVKVFELPLNGQTRELLLKRPPVSQALRRWKKQNGQ